eukprot:gnl/TRDRNA2_/TRDRNA2_179893_c0_seq1.p1 gnl/TRDRNA2_/TRDRNA2_179893_c0~~gnl/TRDRNA2_/TRDRNA2_179893_c0_seq1.p1  ORF type:complete len:358 (+),score=76.78 gnl/TRDRNA2_/TRDRNA2_179893_c0_seq1:161-1234(+)
MQRMDISRALRAALLLLLGGLGDCGYLLISSPTQRSIYYARALTAIEMADGQKMVPVQLTQPGQLLEPVGLAVDNLRDVLYVADPAKGAIVAFRIFEQGVGGHVHIALEEPKDVVTGINPRWVAVDAMGSLYYSDTSSSKIATMSAKSVVQKLTGEQGTSAAGAADDEEETVSTLPVKLYDGDEVSSLKTPQGLAVDGFNIFWVNGDSGKDDGSIVRGLQEAPDSGDMEVIRLSTNTNVAYDVCMAGSRVFFTDDLSKVYAMQKKGGAVVTVTDRLTKPRGCVWDGDGTVFIADKDEGKIYAVSANAPRLQAKQLTMMLEVEGAYGLAMFNGAWSPHAATAVMLAVLNVIFCLDKSF